VAGDHIGIPFFIDHGYGTGVVIGQTVRENAAISEAVPGRHKKKKRSWGDQALGTDGDGLPGLRAADQAASDGCEDSGLVIYAQLGGRGADGVWGAHTVIGFTTPVFPSSKRLAEPQRWKPSIKKEKKKTPTVCWEKPQAGAH